LTYQIFQVVPGQPATACGSSGSFRDGVTAAAWRQQVARDLPAKRPAATNLAALDRTVLARLLPVLDASWSPFRARAATEFFHCIRGLQLR